MIITEPRYSIKSKIWEMTWTPLPHWLDSHTEKYPEKVKFKTYCTAKKFYDAIKEADKLNVNDRQD